MFFGKQKFDVKQLKLNKFLFKVKELKINKFIFDIKQLKMNRFIKSLSGLIISISNATFEVPSQRPWRSEDCLKMIWGSLRQHAMKIINTGWKVSKYAVFSGMYFPAFGVNLERYSVSLCIQSKCGKMQTRANPLFGHFSHSATLKRRKWYLYQANSRNHIKYKNLLSLQKRFEW